MKYKLKTKNITQNFYKINCEIYSENIDKNYC